MTKSELENKHISELHSLAAEAGVERFRLLSKAELVERLADGDGGESGDDGGSRSSRSQRGGRERPQGGRDRRPRGDGGDDDERSERPRRRRRRSSGSREGAREREGASEREGGRDADKPARDRQRTGGADRPAREKAPAREEAPAAESEAPAQRAPETPSAPAAEEGTRPRRRRRRRFGRRGKQGVTLQGLLLPPEAGRQALLFAESREACTALLRSVAADLAADSKGPDPVALLIDPSPEELGDWKREAPQAEIVAAGQARHADDALAQARSRAASGEDVILLVDSLTRLGEAHGDPDAAKDFFDAGRLQGASGGGSLTVVAALERSA
jgi:Rho termination factor-like protein